MKPGEKLVRGDIVQLSPKATVQTFAGRLMVVTDPKSFGAQGYIQMGLDGVAYYRAPWDEIEPTGGKAVWMTDGP